MVLELLEAYHQQHNDVPARLLFFRDGVSEGELAAVQSKEIPQVPFGLHLHPLRSVSAQATSVPL